MSLRWGVLGAAWIARVAMLGAIQSSRNGVAAALAARDAGRARALAAEFEVPRGHDSYDALLADASIDAVYVPLPNSLHLEWARRGLEAGKHVLCEKPLALNAAEAEAMAAAARGSGRLLMEALMYRFHPRMRALRAEAGDIVHLSARFGFTIDAPENYRMVEALGGGALLDVGSYGVSAARWFLGEPVRVGAVQHRAGEIDVSTLAALEFPGGATASAWGSFESPEDQELVLVGPDATQQIQQPFTSWRDPDDPYQLMVEEFAAAVLEGRPAPIPLSESIANLRVLDAIRAATDKPRG